MNDVTRLIKRWERGDPDAFEQLVPLVDNVLRGIARNKLNEEFNSSGMKTTELVNEAYLKLMESQGDISIQSRRHFYRLAARIMRRFLVDRFRKRDAVKHGGEWVQVDIEDNFNALKLNFDQNALVLINQALDKLSTSDEGPLLVSLVELRFFVGFSIKETAQILGIPVIRANRLWAFTRTYLFDFIQQEGESSSGSEK